MTIRIALPTYKIVYEAGGEDLVVSTVVGGKGVRERARLREEERRRCVLLR